MSMPAIDNSQAQISFQYPAYMERVINTRAQLIVLIGGRGSAKSMSIGQLMVNKASINHIDVLCGREYQNSIDDSVHKLVKTIISEHDIPGTIVLEKKIDFMAGGSFRYRGFARSASSVRSAQDFAAAWIEESQDLSGDSIQGLIPTIRAEGSQLFFTANPMASTDAFSKRFIVPFQKEIDRDGFYEDDMHLIMKVNWRDNPWFPAKLENDRKWDKANLTRAEYDHIWEGAYNDSVEASVIRAEWFDASIDAHLKLGFEPRGAKVLAHDPSDQGKDNKAYSVRHGSVVLDVKDRSDLDVNDGCDWALHEAIDRNVDLFVWDGGGMGASLRRQVVVSLDGKKIEYVMFQGAESPENPNAIYEPAENEDRKQARTNKETFKNRRAQFVWKLRDRFYRTWRAVEKGEYIDPDELISISSDIEQLTQLRSETCRIPRKQNASLIQIMSKDEMKRMHKILSPNLFDALYMSFQGLKPKKKPTPYYPIPQLSHTGWR